MSNGSEKSVRAAAMIEMKDVSYSYPHSEETILEQITFDIPTGQFCAVVGPNMAGKSTLCYAIAGFIPHYFQGSLRGEVTVATMNVIETPLSDLAGRIGLVFANPFNQISGVRFTVREEVAFGLENLGVTRQEMLPRIEAVLALTGLEEVADRSPYSLSGGQQQRLALASVLVMRPQVLVLDEPTSQLDPAGTKEVFTILDRLAAQRDTTVVLVSNELEWVASYSDRVLLLDQGRIVADGAPREVLSAQLIVDVGIGRSQFTEAAVLARERKLHKRDAPMPVTLKQAIKYFS